MKKPTMLMTLLAISCLLVGCSDDDPVNTTAPVIDTTPPTVPTGLVCCPDQGYVKLAWDANVTDSDLEGYNVYRNACCQTWLLTPEPIQSNRFIDPMPTTERTLYMVTAVDLLGNESALAQIMVSCPEGVEVIHRD